MKYKDLYTNEEFVPIRINQKFAKAENRIKYHNERAKKLRHKIAYINKPLHQNIKILNDIMKNENQKIFHKEYLKGKGFSFNVHTHIDVFEGKNQYAIYQYVCIPLTNEQIKIISND